MKGKMQPNYAARHREVAPPANIGELTTEITPITPETKGALASAPNPEKAARLYILENQRTTLREELQNRGIQFREEKGEVIIINEVNFRKYVQIVRALAQRLLAQ